MTLNELSPAELDTFVEQQQTAYDALVGQGLKLDITRGKPSAAQLDLSNDLLRGAHETTVDGIDIRNYGGVKGLTTIRQIFADLLGVPLENILAADNASLSIMHDLITFAVLHGTPDSDRPWDRSTIKILCPVPGYDRHFAICEALGIEMIPVPLGEHGPDLARVRELLADDSVKGMWVVPTYANPNGIVYDEATTRELVSMPAAPDFRIIWDNAYAVHHLTDHEYPAIDVLGLATEAGNPNRIWEVASTSKITFAGAGVSFLAASAANLDWYLKYTGFRTIGPNKVNQQAHAEFLGSADGVRELMRKHREIIAPKFAVVDEVLQQRLGEYAVATWTRPEGGYFVTLTVPNGTAAAVVALAKQAGIALTPAGSSHPLKHDPDDAVIRLAPTLPPVAEVRAAMEGVATCVLLAAGQARQAAAGSVRHSAD
ncbi:aminotransferase class I/II-fold pyridoxal phosphate-dependent enzyme [Granulicoccus phenolivorans]|uniref:aminotransferase class I/II-fold pyridoxal phosphate-dependent enzyme n=1 Tax=Granulicoccus phenolivorans TaxID=266854 RepID=UPI0004286853|nr:aminotransferase class I/II-fold pyridoxal phosphate-dependent enzyme [Granulicoccus phenolivorans]